MKRKNILIGCALVGVLSLGACGKAKLVPLAKQIEVELGGTLDAAATSYVKLDEKAAKEAVLDLSAVDTKKTGTYPASVTYKGQAVAFEIVVKDTIAPEVTIANPVTVAVGMPLYTKDVITGITEISGEVTAVFEKAESEVAERPESTEAVVLETEVTEGFMIGDVTCTDDVISFEEIGSYDVLLTVADTSGNEIEVKIPVVVGESPELLGIEDLTVTVGKESVNYLEGVTAKDYKGVDITDKITCDAAGVKLDEVGTYEVLYAVADADGFRAEQKATVTITDKKGVVDKKQKENKKSTAGTNVATGVENKAAGKESGTTAQAGGTSSSGGNVQSSANSNSGNAATVITSPANNNGGNTTAPAPQPAPEPSTPAPQPAPTPTTPSVNNNGGNAPAPTTPPANNNGGNASSAPTTPPANNNSGNTQPPADTNTGMTVPDDFHDDFGGMDVGGADDGTDLGGSSTWY